jgi:hypothetical protein
MVAQVGWDPGANRAHHDVEKDMTVPFQMIGNLATLTVDVDGYKVTVTVEPRAGRSLTTEDADVILTNAMMHFPQRARFPERLGR